MRTIMLLFALASAATASAAGGEHDFDWEFGRWHTSLKRLAKPLSNSGDWVQYEGTTIVRPVLGGRANLVELDVRGAAGRIEGMSLRTFDPAKGEWRLHFANVRDGEVGPPGVGRFTGGRGEFFSEEIFAGKPIRVRFVITVVTHDEARFEQAFSVDGGKSWESNWIAVDRRTGD